MRYERVDELEELRRKAALYDEATKQEPVAVITEISDDGPGMKFVQPVAAGTQLYAHPIPQPDLKELVEQAFRDGFSWGEYSAHAEHAWERGPTEDEAWADSDSRADLAKQETKP